MKKRTFFSLILCLCLFSNSFFIPVNADSIFIVSENGNPVNTGFAYNGFSQMFSSGNIDKLYCACVFSDSNYSNPTFLYFSDTSGTMKYGGFGSGWRESAAHSANLIYSAENNKYYYRQNHSHNLTNRDNSSNYLIIEDVTSLSSDELLTRVLQSEVVATNWGNPADVNISTIYSGNVQNSPSNIDKFTWNNNVDSNGISYISHLDEHPVIEVQAVPVTWKTSTREEMENNSGGDPTIGTGVPLDSYNARTGHLEITWQEVINYLQIEYADIYSYFFDGTYWIMKGWFYQIRLVTDNYTGEWITLSNGLNLTPKKSKKLIEDPYDETIYNLLKEISETNNQTTTVYEYGDNYITINTDPSNGWQDPDGGGSFWDFLASVVKAISDGIASIVSSVASLVGDLVNGILGLFTFDTFEINNYNTEVQTLKDNSGIFGQSIEFADSIKDSIRGVEQQPAVLHFDGIVIDNVQLIPAVDLDFDQMVVDAGLTDFHNLVYVFTDGTILISLIIMVHHKVMEVLRK